MLIDYTFPLYLILDQQTRGRETIDHMSIQELCYIVEFSCNSFLCEKARKAIDKSTKYMSNSFETIKQELFAKKEYEGFKYKEDLVFNESYNYIETLVLSREMFSLINNELYLLKKDHKKMIARGASISRHRKNKEYKDLTIEIKDYEEIVKWYYKACNMSDDDSYERLIKRIEETKELAQDLQ